MLLFYLGLDVAKQKLDVTLLLDPEMLRKRQRAFPNTPAGYQSLVQWCQHHTGAAPSVCHAILEATGPYHEGAAQALHAAGLVVSVINPKRVKDFAQGLGIKAKNDPIDSFTLARFGHLTKPRPWQPELPEYRRLTALLRRLEALETDRQREANRLEKARLSQPAEAEVIASLERSLEWLDSEGQPLRAAIEDPIDRHPTLRQQRQRLRSIPGIGPVLSRRLVALLQHGQRFASVAQFASYLGLTPTEHQSGSSVRGRPHLSKTGPGAIRAKLYMAAIVASRCNPDVRALYKRLQANGKSKMAALGAAMRKLAHICFGIIKTQTTYQPQTT